MFNSIQPLAKLAWRQYHKQRFHFFMAAFSLAICVTALALISIWYSPVFINQPDYIKQNNLMAIQWVESPEQQQAFASKKLQCSTHLASEYVTRNYQSTAFESQQSALISNQNGTIIKQANLSLVTPSFFSFINPPLQAGRYPHPGKMEVAVSTDFVNDSGFDYKHWQLAGLTINGFPFQVVGVISDNYLAPTQWSPLNKSTPDVMQSLNPEQIRSLHSNSKILQEISLLIKPEGRLNSERLTLQQFQQQIGNVEAAHCQFVKLHNVKTLVLGQALTDATWLLSASAIFALASLVGVSLFFASHQTRFNKSRQIIGIMTSSATAEMLISVFKLLLLVSTSIVISALVIILVFLLLRDLAIAFNGQSAILSLALATAFALISGALLMAINTLLTRGNNATLNKQGLSLSQHRLLNASVLLQVLLGFAVTLLVIYRIDWHFEQLSKAKRLDFTGWYQIEMAYSNGTSTAQISDEIKQVKSKLVVQPEVLDVYQLSADLLALKADLTLFKGNRNIVAPLATRRDNQGNVISVYRGEDLADGYDSIQYGVSIVEIEPQLLQALKPKLIVGDLLNTRASIDQTVLTRQTAMAIYGRIPQQGEAIPAGPKTQHEDKWHQQRFVQGVIENLDVAGNDLVTQFLSRFNTTFIPLATGLKKDILSGVNTSYLVVKLSEFASENSDVQLKGIIESQVTLSPKLTIQSLAQKRTELISSHRLYVTAEVTMTLVILFSAGLGVLSASYFSCLRQQQALAVKQALGYAKTTLFWQVLLLESNRFASIIMVLTLMGVAITQVLPAIGAPMVILSSTQALLGGLIMILMVINASAISIWSVLRCDPMLSLNQQ